MPDDDNNVSSAHKLRPALVVWRLLITLKRFSERLRGSWLGKHFNLNVASAARGEDHPVLVSTAKHERPTSFIP